MKVFISKSSRMLLVLLSTLSLSCSNLFLEMADKTSDKSLYYSAKLKIDNSDWSGAITDILATSADFQAKREVKFTLAAAYAGRCGLDLLDLADKIQNAGATSFFSVLLAAFRSKTATQLADCLSAEGVISAISSSVAGRNTDENMLMAFVALSKMGIILNVLADADADGTVDAGFLPCNSTTGTGTTALPDGPVAPYVDASELVASLSQFVMSLSVVGAGGGTTFDEIEAYCDQLAAAPFNVDVCNTTDRTAVTATQRRAIRAAVVDNSGFGFAINDATTGGVCAVDTCFTVNCAAY